MRNRFKLLYAFLVICIISSCSGGGNSRSEIKLIPVKSGKNYQYIDREGNIIINPQFKEATVFSDGMALIKTSGDEPKFGYIKEDGKISLSNYKEATIFSEGLAWVVSENAAPVAINSSGEIKATLQDAQNVRTFSEGLSAFSIVKDNEQKWGFVNKEGMVIINPQFSKVGDFSNGRCAVKNEDGEYGYIDKKGKIIINHQFTQASPFHNNKAIVSSDSKAGLIDEAGKYVVNPQFEEMIYDGDKYMIKQDNKWGWCNDEGTIIINPQFEKASNFNGSNLAPVKMGKRWAYINTEGKTEVNPQFDYALPYNGNIAAVLSGSKIGFIDEEGKFSINPQFEKLSPDFIYYLLGGRGKYIKVETDYFNIESIASRINVKRPEGFSINQSKISDIQSKLNLTERNFNKYSKNHQVINGEKITNDASLSMSVKADAYNEVEDGWYTKKVFNPSAQIRSYSYSIKLSWKRRGKEELVKNAIEKSFTDLKKDEEQSTKEKNVYTNGEKRVTSYIKNSRIIIAIEGIDSVKLNKND